MKPKNIKTKTTFKERYQGKTRRPMYRSDWALSDNSIVKLVNRFRKIYHYPIYTKHTVTRVKDEVYSLIVVGHDDKGEQFMVAAFKSRVFAIFKDSPFRKRRWFIGGGIVKRRKWGEGQYRVISLKECNS
ncbi:MAG: hypothetical protein LBI53_00405 [Candidatus Peribacteria bacterium]|nr:hypothetical protein [Candidatus Peribacteria bacterium]